MATGWRRVVGYLWASPWTVAAAALVPLVRASGGRAKVRAGVLELEGGVLRWLLPRLAPNRSIAAMTLGHAVVATDPVALARTRAHERAHVEQYERWGPFFPAIYGMASAAAWLRGGDAYLDNRFEREARQRELGAAP